MGRKVVRAARVVAVPVVLALIALGIQFSLNSVRERPKELGEAVAMVIRDIHPERGRSLRADVWMSVNPSWRGCPDSALVRIVFSGTPGFWEDHERKLRGEHRFAVGIASIADLRVRDVTFGFAANADVAPILPEFGGPESSSEAAPLDALEVAEPQEQGGSWQITGTIRDWGAHWAPLAVEFTADWVSTRTLGSCYVRLPSLTGTEAGPRAAAVNTALDGLYGIEDVTPIDERAAREQFAREPTPEDALTMRIDRERARAVPASAGRIVVQARSGELMASESSPGPGASSATEAVWTCAPSDADREPEPDEGVPSPNGKARAYTPSPVTGQDLGCEGTAVIRSPSLDVWRNALLVLIGILAAWAVDSAKKIPERWRGKGPAKA
jgi:hypothetical protein